MQGEGKGILFNLDKVGPVEQATTSFGQGVSVTPIQQVAAVAVLSMAGIYINLILLRNSLIQLRSKLSVKKSPSVKRKVISKETSEKVRYALENVVAKGSGRSAYIDGYRVGGKTGTAQKVKGWKIFRQ